MNGMRGRKRSGRRLDFRDPSVKKKHLTTIYSSCMIAKVNQYG